VAISTNFLKSATIYIQLPGLHTILFPTKIDIWCHRQVKLNALRKIWTTVVSNIWIYILWIFNNLKAQANIKEYLNKHEFTKQLTTKELIWFIVSNYSILVLWSSFTFIFILLVDYYSSLILCRHLLYWLCLFFFLCCILSQIFWYSSRSVAIEAFFFHVPAIGSVVIRRNEWTFGYYIQWVFIYIYFLFLDAVWRSQGSRHKRRHADKYKWDYLFHLYCY
jgi:hypothetical protein